MAELDGNSQEQAESIGTQTDSAVEGVTPHSEGDAHTNPTENGRNPDGTFAVGNPGGPGRPAGSISIIGKIKQIWEQNPEQFDAYVAEVMKDTKLRQELIRQIDGAPKQQVDVTSDGKALTIAPVIYGDNQSTA